VLASTKVYRWKADMSDVEKYVLGTINCDNFIRSGIIVSQLSVSNLFGKACQLGLPCLLK